MWRLAWDFLFGILVYYSTEIYLLNVELPPFKNTPFSISPFFFFFKRGA